MEAIKSWDILTIEEQSTLSLTMGHGKSTWEGGEILGKAHYKYLEILQRAQKFINLFEDHLTEYNGVIPKTLYEKLPKEFLEYIEAIITERKLVKDVVLVMSTPGVYSVKSLRDNEIAVCLTYLHTSKAKEAKALFHIIREFDRYNNFRILPLAWQLPSGFKRRNKNRDLKHLKAISSLPKVSVILLKKKYGYVGKYKTVFIPIISLGEKHRVKHIIEIRDKPKFIDNMTAMGFFVYTDKAITFQLVELIYNYLEKVKTPGKGQKFWPEFRRIAQLAVNIKELDNVIPHKRLLKAEYEKYGVLP